MRRGGLGETRRARRLGWVVVSAVEQQGGSRRRVVCARAREWAGRAESEWQSLGGGMCACACGAVGVGCWLAGWLAYSGQWTALARVACRVFLAVPATSETRSTTAPLRITSFHLFPHEVRRASATVSRAFLLPFHVCEYSSWPRGSLAVPYSASASARLLPCFLTRWRAPR